MKFWPSLLLLATSFLSAQSSVDIITEPKTPLIELRGEMQHLQFDFAVRNTGTHTLRLSEMVVCIYDSRHQLALKKTINSNGLRPGIEVAAPVLLRPGETSDIFNPFYEIDDDVHIATMEYAFHFLIEDTPEQHEANRHRLPMDFDIEQRASVLPSDYKSKTAFALPLAGRVLVWEGHDYFAHHRRIPLDAEKTKRLGIRANANRYAVDLVIVNENGEMWHDDPFQKTNYYVYLKPIYAPADGVVKESRNDVPDNEFVGRNIRDPQLPPGADENLGNFVLIDHGNGKFSVFPHMEKGTVRVKAGDRISRGEVLGQVGFSGDAIFPHVHYTLLSAPDVYQSEGIPSYFDVIRILGKQRVHDRHAALDSGDIVETTEKRSTTTRSQSPRLK